MTMEIIPRVSVILCTHNPREDYLKRVLDALEAQTLPRDQWELLLVDNGSDKPLCDTWDLSRFFAARHVLERTPGKLEAMLCGIANSRGQVLITVDDDNVLNENYLEVACAKISEYPTSGTWSGTNVGEFEKEPMESLSSFLPFLAINHEDGDRLSGDLEHAFLPIGAGMVVRREVADLFLEFKKSESVASKLLLHRAPGRLHAGQEDTEVGIVSLKNGYACGRTSQLNLIHIIPADRLRLGYLLRLVFAISFSHAVIYKSHDIRRPFWDISVQFRALVKQSVKYVVGAVTLDKRRVASSLSGAVCCIGRMRGSLL